MAAKVDQKKDGKDAKVDATAVLGELSKADAKKLEHVHTVQGSAVTEMKLHAQITKADTAKLHHVETKGGGLTEAEKKAFIEEKKGGGAAAAGAAPAPAAAGAAKKAN